ncbi:MAG: archease [Candidatus Micrarchaeota archaeon]|nr:archease [Candidatus Micrarchaeota archaeon]
MKGKAYRYLPHTADMAFVGYGTSLEEAIENSALALLCIMLDTKRIGRAKARPLHLRISEKADTVEDLVWFSLQDIVSVVDSRNLKAYGFVVDKMNSGRKFSMSGRLLYKRLDGDYALNSVKAVTPHDLRVAKSGRRFSVNVTVDV